jgi:hypothetical protein
MARLNLMDAELHEKVMLYVHKMKKCTYGIIITSPDSNLAIAFNAGSLQYANLDSGAIKMAERREYGFHGKVLYLEIDDIDPKPLNASNEISDLLRDINPRRIFCDILVC